MFSLSKIVMAKLQKLSAAEQQQVLNFVEFLTQKQVSCKPIWEEFDEIIQAVPEAEWDYLPIDVALQHDHYLYGTPKKQM
jgi:hypothetical protein